MKAHAMSAGYDGLRKNPAKMPKAKTATENVNLSNVRVNESVGVMFLGTLAILLLIFLVRSNRRNRELLLEVISLKRQP